MLSRAVFSCVRILAPVFFVFGLVACGGGSGSGSGSDTKEPVVTSFTISGTASGLSGGSVELANNGGDNLTISANGSFIFSSTQPDQSLYNVAVSTQPNAPAQTCSVNHAGGIVNAANVSNIQVVCSIQSYTVGATVSGLSGSGLILQNNGSDNFVVSANGAMTFASAQATGANYKVSIASQPSDSICTVVNGTGTLATSNINDVAINCATATTYSVGGQLSGLGSGKSVVLRNNGNEALTVISNGAFSFNSTLANSATYSVTVSTNAVGQSCVVSNGTDTITGANISSVSVSCSDLPAYSVGGQVSGLANGASVVLRNNGGNNLTVTANGSFGFSTALYSGNQYNVTVLTQPANPAQTCSVTNSSGTVASESISNVNVACVTNEYAVGGTISGLGSGKSLVLQNNGSNNLTASANGGFNFSQTIASGSHYAITVLTQPAGQNCVVGNGNDVVGNVAVNNVQVTCANIPTYTIGGSVTGLANGTNVVLRNNGGNNLTVSANGSFAFSTALVSSSSYSVTVLTNPAGQSCSIRDGLGTVGSVNITDVQVICGANRSLSGTVYGLTGSGLVLQSSTGETLPITGTGTVNFAFSQQVGQGSLYSVSVLTQPATPVETCYVSNDSGTVGASHITNLAVVCPMSFEVTHPKPQGQGINEMKLLNNKLVGVTTNGSVLIGNNTGTNWTVSSVGGPYSLEGVAWTGTQYVVVGKSNVSPYNGVVLTSPDGITWTSQTIPTTNALEDIAWTGSTLIAVGASGTIITSTNGVSWALRTSGTTNTLYGVTAGNNIFAAGAGIVLISTNSGTSWTQVAWGTGWVITSVASVGNTSVAAGVKSGVYPGAAYVLRTTNGLNWTEVAASNLTGINGFFDVTHNGSQWIGVGYKQHIATSNDGISWTLRNSSTVLGDDLYSVLWNSSTSSYVVTGNAGDMLTSVNGTSWSYLNNFVTSVALSDAIWTGDRLIAIGGSGYSTTTYDSAIISSPDGLNGWEKIYGGTAGTLRSIAANGNQLVAVGDVGFILNSTDRGVTWSPVSSGVTANLQLIRRVGSQFVVVGTGGTILTSSNGINWTSRNSTVTGSLSNIAVSGTRLLVTGENIVTSDDQGVTWTNRSTYCSNASVCSDTIWTGSRFVASRGTSSTIYTSVDGATWSQHSIASVALGIYKMIVVGDTLFAIGYDSTRATTGKNMFLESADGITWKRVNYIDDGANRLLWTGSRLFYTSLNTVWMSE